MSDYDEYKAKAEAHDSELVTRTQFFEMDVLKPGDTVLLCVKEDAPDYEQVRPMMDLLTERFPDVHFVIAAGISGVVRVPATPDATEGAEAPQIEAQDPSDVRMHSGSAYGVLQREAL